jgi:hypothetical protein
MTSKRLPLFLLMLISISSVTGFCWGFWGFVEKGSSGPPSDGHLIAFWSGGAIYLVALLFSMSAEIPYGEKNKFYVVSSARNLKYTLIALLLCFPLAFLFIGFILPPVIFVVSLACLVVSAVSSETDVNRASDLDDRVDI